jgi:hypothetical protein
MLVCAACALRRSRGSRRAAAISRRSGLAQRSRRRSWVPSRSPNDTKPFLRTQPLRRLSSPTVPKPQPGQNPRAGRGRAGARRLFMPRPPGLVRPARPGGTPHASATSSSPFPRPAREARAPAGAVAVAAVHRSPVALLHPHRARSTYRLHSPLHCAHTLRLSACPPPPSSSIGRPIRTPSQAGSS